MSSFTVTDFILLVLVILPLLAYSILYPIVVWMMLTVMNLRGMRIDHSLYLSDYDPVILLDDFSTMWDKLHGN